MSRDDGGGRLPLVLDHVRFEAGGRRIIDDVSLAIAVGGSTVILGPNGAGKSVLMRLCHGLLAPTTGSVRWSHDVRDGDSLRPGEKARASGGERAGAPRHAMVFQKPVLLRRSAIDNVRYALALHGVRGEAGRARATQALVRVGLAGIADQPARALSGGEQQRLAVARAWALEPAVMFLDEPTASLDPAAAQDVERLIGAIAAAGTKVVMTTHHLALAARLAGEVIFMWNGRVLEQSPAAAFFRRPRSPEAAAFINAEVPRGVTGASPG